MADAEKLYTFAFDNTDCYGAIGTQTERNRHLSCHAQRFEDNEDFQRMVGSLYALCHRFDEEGNRLPALCSFYAYCIMSNHVHLLLQEKEESIGQKISKRV